MRMPTNLKVFALPLLVWLARVPRVRGDEPFIQVVAIEGFPCSPRARG